MSLRGGWWRVDDWFRPVASMAPGRAAAWPGRRAVTPRDRRWMLAFLVTAAVVVATLFLLVDAGSALVMSGGFLGASLVQGVRLFTTRGTGFGLRR